MIKLRVDDETAIPLSVDSSSAVPMTVSEAFIDRGGSAIQNNKNATPSTSQVVVTPDPGYDALAKVTVEAVPQGALSPIDIDFDDDTGAFTAEARVGTSGYISDNAFVGGGFQLDTQAAATITPSNVQRQAVPAHKYTTGAVVVDPIPSEYIIPSGTKQITANGNAQDVAAYEKVNVNVPNSYAAADEGKVVQSGALVSQSSATYTENGTYDTTTKNEVVVNVSSGIPDWVRDTNAISFDASNAVVNGDVVFDFGSMDVSFKARKITSTKDNATMEIKCGVLTLQNAALSDYNGSSKFRTAILTCSNNPVPTAEFTRATHFVHILGKPLSVTALGTKTYRIFNSASIQEFYVVPNMIELGQGGVVTGALYDATLVSLANGLKGGLATPQTLTIGDATSKNKCDSIMGTVSSVTDDTGTYDFFTADPGGSVSITQFITTTKGWTLA